MRFSSLQLLSFFKPSLLLALTSGVLLSAASAYGETQTTAKPATTETAEIIKHHALTLIDPPQLAKDFTHFPFANPHAPKAGKMRRALLSKFDSLNPFSLKGDAFSPVLSNELVHERLMESSPDERAVQYGLIAEWASFPDDYASVTFQIRSEAKFSDGSPITPDDVIFSMEAVKKAHPGYKAYYKNVVKGEKTGERQVTFQFDVKNNRELPFIVGELPILSKAWWTGKNAKGEQRDITKTTLEAPIGSGPYLYDQIKPGQKIVLKRNEDYWAKDLPVRRGLYNFNEVIFEVYRDSNVAFEGFKADHYDYQRESRSKAWATAYDFPALKKGLVIKRGDIKLGNPHPMQGFIFNLRRAKFKDINTRKALNLAYNFEWANENLFYGQYKRTSSYFENTDMAAGKLPDADETKIIKSLNGKVPEEIFTKIYQNPVFATREDERKNLRQAGSLLKQAGWRMTTRAIEDKNCGFFCKILITIGLKTQKTKPQLVNDKGEPFKIEFLVVSPSFQRVILPFIKNLERLGIHANIRLVDSSQYINRVRQFDFDIIVHSISQSFSPGNEQRGFWGSKAADTPGSRNLIGIKNPAVDQLVDKIIYAKNRKDLVLSARALDRVLLWNYYLIPQWHTPNERIAYWDRFGIPKQIPKYAIRPITLWWWDDMKAAKIKDTK